MSLLLCRWILYHWAMGEALSTGKVVGNIMKVSSGEHRSLRVCPSETMPLFGMCVCVCVCVSVSVSVFLCVCVCNPKWKSLVKKDVLVSQGCCNTLPLTFGFNTTEIWILPVWKFEKRCQQSIILLQVLGLNSFLPLTDFCWVWQSLAILGFESHHPKLSPS